MVAYYDQDWRRKKDIKTSVSNLIYQNCQIKENYKGFTKIGIVKRLSKETVYRTRSESGALDYIVVVANKNNSIIDIADIHLRLKDMDLDILGHLNHDYTWSFDHIFDIYFEMLKRKFMLFGVDTESFDDEKLLNYSGDDVNRMKMKIQNHQTNRLYLNCLCLNMGIYL